jgi:hypothetical protein
MRHDRTPINFQLRLTEKDIAFQGRSRIAFINGMQPRQVNPLEVGQMVTVFTRGQTGPFPVEVYERYIGQVGKIMQENSEQEREVIEKEQSLLQAADLLVPKKIRRKSRVAAYYSEKTGSFGYHGGETLRSWFSVFL